MNYIKIVNQTCQLLSQSYEKLTETHVFEIKEDFSYLTKAISSGIKKDKSFVKTMEDFYTKLFDKYFNIFLFTILISTMIKFLFPK